MAVAGQVEKTAFHRPWTSGQAAPPNDEPIGRPRMAAGAPPEASFLAAGAVAETAMVAVLVAVRVPSPSFGRPTAPDGAEDPTSIVRPF